MDHSWLFKLGLMASRLLVITVTVLSMLFLWLWQHGGEFKVALSDVLMAWKHLLLDKLHLPPPSFARLENYDLILETYKSFLQRSNTVDLVDIFSMYTQLRDVDSDPEEPISPVSRVRVRNPSAVDAIVCWVTDQWVYLTNRLFYSFAKVHLFEFLANSEVSALPELSVPSTPSSQSKSRISQVGPVLLP